MEWQLVSLMPLFLYSCFMAGIFTTLSEPLSPIFKASLVNDTIKFPLMSITFSCTTMTLLTSLLGTWSILLFQSLAQSRKWIRRRNEKNSFFMSWIKFLSVLTPLGIILSHMSTKHDHIWYIFPSVWLLEVGVLY